MPRSHRPTTPIRRLHRGSRSASQFIWESLPDNELLDWRLCDLGLRIEGTVIEERIAKLYDELEHRGISFRPHCWLSSEWFSPDDIPGIAVPFYLAHPRLARLEYRQVFDIEGGTQQWFMKILRHEAGHSIDTAFGLSRRKRWREVFGNPVVPYPEEYRPKLHSHQFVRHLGQWYAQSHPSEDFAETFAVWVKPRSRWRYEYSDWSAIHKLQYVDELMQQLATQRPSSHSRAHIDPLSKQRKTLREHYAAKREQYGIGNDCWLDLELYQLFTSHPTKRHLPLAGTFLRNHRRELCATVARTTAHDPYTVNQVLQEMIDRCVELRLRVAKPIRTIRSETRRVLVFKTLKMLNSRHHKVAL